MRALLWQKYSAFAGRRLATSESVALATSPGPSAAALHAPQGAPDIADSAAVLALPPGLPNPEGDAAHFAAASPSYGNDSAASVESANTVDERYCAVPSCGQSCSDYTSSHAAENHNQNYLWYGGQSTCHDLTFPFIHTQYEKCCVQVCSIDSDCPSSYYCQSGWNVNGGSVCTECTACSVTQNTKCQMDQQCKFDCCASPAGIGCLAPGLPNSAAAISPEMCCPSMPSSFHGHATQNGYFSVSCQCDTQQVCSLLPAPSRSPVPSPPPHSPPPVS